jgi:hypothetical protein
LREAPSPHQRRRAWPHTRTRTPSRDKAATHPILRCRTGGQEGGRGVAGRTHPVHVGHLRDEHRRSLLPCGHRERCAAGGSTLACARASQKPSVRAWEQCRMPAAANAPEQTVSIANCIAPTAKHRCPADSHVAAALDLPKLTTGKPPGQPKPSWTASEVMRASAAQAHPADHHSSSHHRRNCILIRPHSTRRNASPKGHSHRTGVTHAHQPPAWVCASTPRRPPDPRGGWMGQTLALPFHTEAWPTTWLGSAFS